MKKKMLFYSLPLSGFQVCGKVPNLASLSARFQIWCRKFGISDNESLALWTAGGGDEDNYFSDPTEAEMIAVQVVDKLPHIGVDLSDEFFEKP